MATKKGYQLLKPLPGAKKPKTAIRPTTTGGPVRTGPGGRPLPKEIPLGNAPAGRPVSNIGQYLIKPIDDENSGFEMLNAEPKILDQVNKQYLRQGMLPPALQPKYLRKPDVLDTNRAKNISRGWRAPRSRQG